MTLANAQLIQRMRSKLALRAKLRYIRSTGLAWIALCLAIGLMAFAVQFDSYRHRHLTADDQMQMDSLFERVK